MNEAKLVKPGEIGWNAYAAMICDTDHGLVSTIADGVLQYHELEQHIRVVEGKVDKYNKDILHPGLTDARRALQGMKKAGVGGVEYLPENCRALPENLRRLATEILVVDDRAADGKITRELIDDARFRYRTFEKIPTWVVRRPLDAVLNELNQLEKALFPSAETRNF